MTVAVAPSVHGIIGPNVVCPNSEGIGYAVDADEYSTIEWLIEGGTLAGSSGGAIKVDWGSSTDDASVSAQLTSAQGCQGGKMIFPVRINVVLKPSLPMGQDSVCYNFRQGVTYSTINSNGSVYTWGLTGGEIQAGQGSSQAVVDWFDLGQRRVWVAEHSETITDICDGVSDTLSVVVFKDAAQIVLNFVTTEFEDEGRVRIKWEAELVDRISDLLIVSKRKNSEDQWEIVARISKTIGEFLDDRVFTDQNIYFYRIEGFNRCDEGLVTEVQHTILLSGESDRENTISLAWNECSGWELGVEHYEIWRALDDESEFRLLNVVDSDVSSYVGQHGIDGFRHRLRVKAKESGRNAISWSNDVELKFDHPLTSSERDYAQWGWR